MALAKDHRNRIWVDMEMSGLGLDCRILEVAVRVTDSTLEEVSEPLVCVIHQPEEVLAKMDFFNRVTHKQSGLIDKVRASKLNEAAAEELILAFVEQYVPKGRSPLCGYRTKTDGFFLRKYLPRFDGYLNHASGDVDALATFLEPLGVPRFEKRPAHSALADVDMAIEMARYYASFARPSA